MQDHENPEEKLLREEVQILKEEVEILVDLLDLEEHSKGSEPPPRAKAYRLRIDDHYYTTPDSELTGAQILELASKTPSGFNLRQRFRGGKVESISPEQVVDLRKHGVERFMTIPKENTDGEEPLSKTDSGTTPAEKISPRREFALGEADTDYLKANHPDWEAVQDGGSPYIVLPDFPIPPGYNHSSAKVAINITPGYPVAHLDMVYFSPGLARTNGRPINALNEQTIMGQLWQRWSRHYAWRTGIDDLSTHVERIKTWLDNELSK